MAFNNDIILDTDKTYSRILTGRTSGKWSDVSQNVDSPKTLTISHETAKNGRVNSVIIVDSSLPNICETTCATDPASSTIKAQFKLSYNPIEGYTDIDVALTGIIDLLMEVVNDPARIAKLKNKEA